MGTQTILEAAGRKVVITNPGKFFFPRAGYSKLDLAQYYLAVAGAALRVIAGRPIVLKRYVNGAESEPFFRSARRSSILTGSRRWSFAFHRDALRARSSCAMSHSFSGSST